MTDLSGEIALSSFARKLITLFTDAFSFAAVFIDAYSVSAAFAGIEVVATATRLPRASEQVARC